MPLFTEAGEASYAITNENGVAGAVANSSSSSTNVITSMSTSNGSDKITKLNLNHDDNGVWHVKAVVPSAHPNEIYINFSDTAKSLTITVKALSDAKGVNEAFQELQIGEPNERGIEIPIQREGQRVATDNISARLKSGILSITIDQNSPGKGELHVRVIAQDGSGMNGATFSSSFSNT